MWREIPVWTISWIALLLCWLGFASSVMAQSDAESLEAIVQVFNANRERFASFSTTFQVTKGIATSEEAGWREEYQHVYRQDGLLVAKKGDLRYELKCLNGELTMEEHAKLRADPSNTSSMTTALCGSRGELWAQAQNTRITFGSMLRVVNFRQAEPVEATHTPLSLGIMGPGERFSPIAFIQGSRAGKHYCKYLGTEQLDGTVVDVIECGLDPITAEQHKFYWYLDLARGAIPLKWRSVNPDGTTRAELRTTAIRRMENGGYICEKCVALFTGKMGFNVWIIEITDIDMTEPSRDMLAIDLPSDWSVIDMKDMRSVVKITVPEKLYIDELPQWIERCDLQLQKVIAVQRTQGISMEAPLPATPPKRGAWPWVTLAGLCLAVLGAAVLVRRFLSR